MQNSRKRLTSWRVLVALTLVLGLYSAVTVSPAAAGHNESHAAGDCGIFSGLNSLGTSASGARGDVMREPALDQTVTEMPDSAKGKGGKSFRATVPVYYHVVHAGGVGNISREVVDRQMQVLNHAFAGFYGGAATGFSFKLVGITRTDNAEWHYAGIGSSAERAMKKSLRTGGWNALNLYSVDAAGYLGWAYFPGLSEARQYLDGVIVNWRSMPGASTAYAGRYDLGQTATHEVGHWIHLHHVFNGACNNYGDYVEDTPPQAVATNGCPIGQDSCREPGIDSIHNYMDYSYDSCYNQFTKGQVQRMQDAWLYYRA